MHHPKLILATLLLVPIAAIGAPRTAHAASLVVTNTNDSGPGSLRAAINLADSVPSSSNVITFNIPGGPTPTITISSTLTITSPIHVDGTTQPGYDGAYNRVYVVGKDGANVSSLFLLTNHNGTDIQGLGLNKYVNNAVTIWFDSNWNFVDDDYIGFQKIGSSIDQNRQHYSFTAGIGIAGSYNKIRRTTISGVYNAIVAGEAIEGPWDGKIVTDNLFEYNRIGSDPTGMTSAGFGNDSDGIFFGHGVKNSWIGPYNVFSGQWAGIEFLAPSDTGNRVYYNYLGTNDGGTAVIGNGEAGLQIGNGATNNGAWGNVISGNRLAGVTLGSADGNWIWNNTIGLDKSQTRVLGGQNSGITANVDSRAQTSPVRNSIEGNMIGGHNIHGIEMYNAVGNGVYHNWIGMNSAGTPMPNRYFGVYLQDSSYNMGSGNAWGSNGAGAVGIWGGTGNHIS